MEYRDFEQSEQFWNDVDKARRSISEGKGLSDKEARRVINEKSIVW